MKRNNEAPETEEARIKNYKIFGYTWVSITAFVFLALASTLSISIAVIVLLQRLRAFDSPIGIRGSPVIIFILLMIIIGSLLSLVFAQIINRPIRRLRKAMKLVAEGDFSVRLRVTSNSDASRLLRDFNQMVVDLGSIETMRNDFIANVSHEFKTPISVIEAYAQLLESPNISDEERREYAAMISDSAAKLSVLTSNILSLSKLEHQGYIMKRDTFSLDEQLRRSVLMFESEWSAKNLDLDIDLEPVKITGCEELLEQVWQNLIGNAIKFTDAGGRVSVSLRGGDECTVRISDTGIGIAPDAMEHIFDKFYQGDKSRSRQGNGLGLTLVKEILDQTGGSITVESKVGEGSTFTVKLPIYR